MASRQKKVKTVADFTFLGSKIIVDGDCNHKIKMLAPWRKSYDKLDRVLKSKDITLPKTFFIVKVMFFPVVMYGCESLTIKKAECQRIDAFEPWGWRRLLRVLWTARQSNLILNDQEFRNSFLNINWKD